MTSIGLMEADQREAMGRAGRDMAEREFDEGRVVRAYLDAIGQLSAVARS